MLKNIMRSVLCVVLLLASQMRGGEVSAGQPATLRNFDGNAGWINSPPLTLASLRGKVVLVDFWEYTCINCLRTLPYLREWYRRYHSDGFVIIGVHTPEFRFSGLQANVAAAVKRLKIAWPVVLDSSDAIWDRYHNTIWPHELLFDPDGHLVESIEGEGGYQQTEANIQMLLRAAHPQLSLPPVMALLPQDSYDKPGAVCYPQTAEILVAHHAVANATAFNEPLADTRYIDRGTHTDGRVYLQGFWHRTPQAVVSGGGPGFLDLAYHAVQLVGVLKSEHGTPVRVDVTQDGNPVPKDDAGRDIHYDSSGMSFIKVEEPRAYDIVMNAKFGYHTLRLTPQTYGLGVYSFAFESCEVPGHT